MIEPGQHGKNLQDIPEQCFDYGFDREDRWPGLVLASTVTVPNGNTDGWRLATQSCGGFSCDEFQAAVLPLPVRPEMLRFLETVAEEEFSPAPLDYFNMMDAADAAAVKKGYLSCLHRAGLSCSEHNLSLLTQALYPVDATAENMKILVGNCTELAAMKVPGGLTIFIVGQNCD
ncbi:hypothetical protein [Klebsiella pneumoniae]|uniref:hypothetical protein n=1 Tax=Klebsiella pneumoniae TaxID=573 RepID=UPI0010340BFB|nr:hypothetical protein [Klebsiella pneumoniae]HDS2526727.1 hypothetical protein [Klebsiella pneumoniae subsp. pneumoniae]